MQVFFRDGRQQEAQEFFLGLRIRMTGEWRLSINGVNCQRRLTWKMAVRSVCVCLLLTVLVY